MNAATTFSPDQAACEASMGTKKIEMNTGRIAAWTLIFTNTFFVSYFLAKLLRWV
jgi:hypothetical protein